ncbi:MAG: ABC transporter substrate-binding protein [Thermoleophilia bacterium]
MSPRLAIAVLFIALVGFATGCSNDDQDPAAGVDPTYAAATEGLAGRATFGAPQAGGTFRVATADLGLSAGLDPSSEYTGDGWGLLQSLLVRPILSYAFTAGAAGNTLRPDLAAEMPRVSADGLTYTLRLRRGVRFGPPLSRDVEAGDVIYAFERLATPSVTAQYGFYYSVIEGFTAAAAGRDSRISGLSAPDDHTVVIRLVRRTPDFLDRLALPATAPIPPEIGRCHTGASEYGRYLVSTGPYMIEGADRIGTGPCAAQHPANGFDPSGSLDLVRNPEYDPATDDPSVREALPDRFEIRTNANVNDIFARIARGELETSLSSPPPAVTARYAGDADLRARLRVNTTSSITYVAMNLTEPPFDDVHVRRAMNYALDLDGMRRVLGGPLTGPILTHAMPSAVLPDDTLYFQRPPFDGDLEAAREEMARSRYDHDGDGMCDASACRGVVAINDSSPPAAAMGPILRDSAGHIGIALSVRQIGFGAGSALAGEPAKRIPLNNVQGWAKDFDDPSGYVDPLLTTGGIRPAGSTNTSLVGITPELAHQVGARYPPGGVPSVDKLAAACGREAAEARMACYEALDRRVMTEVVPWVPHQVLSKRTILGPAVTQFDFDESSSGIAWSHLALDPALQAG